MPQPVDLDYQFELMRQSPSDTNEHLQTLKTLAQNCNHCTEFGVRWVVTTWALLAARPQRLVSYDYETNIAMLHNIEIVKLTAQANNISFDFYEQDVIASGFTIEQTDLLYIDIGTDYAACKQAIEQHYTKVNKYIVVHGINVPRDIDGNPTNIGGPYQAAQEFLQANTNWSIELEDRAVHGLLVLKKVS